MSLDSDITDVADSEEEPLTYSPDALSGEAVDKLSATARQDTQALACPYQGSVQNTANEATNRTADFNADQEEPLLNAGTAQIDRTVLESAQSAENTDTRTCTVEDQVKAAILLPEANTVATSTGDQINDAEACKDNDENNTSLKVQLTSSGNGAPTHSNERSSASANAVINPTHREGIEKQPGSLSSQHVDIVQGNDQTTSSIVLPHPGDYLADAEEMYHGCVIGEQAVPHYSSSTAMQHKTRKQEDIACETVAVGPSSNNDYENAVKPNKDATTNRSVDRGCAQQSDACTADTSSLVGLGSPSAAIVLTEPDPNSVQNASDSPAVMTTSSELHDSCGTAQGLGFTHVTEPIGTPTFPLRVSPKLMNKDYEIEYNRASQSLADALHVTKTTQISHGDQCVDNGVDLGGRSQDMTMNVDSTEQRTTVLSTDQSLKESCRLKEATPTMVKVLVPGPSAQIRNAAVDSLDKVDASSTSTLDQSQFQSDPTVSRTSEAAPPCTVTKLTPQEIKLDELKAQKAALLASLAVLPAIQVLIEETQSSDVETSDDNGGPTDADVTTAANRMVKEHIKLLHEYNELKDIGQGLMGLIADQRGVRIVEVQDEFGIDAND